MVTFMANTEQVNTYTGATEQAGLSGIRHQIGMYIGSTGVVDQRHAPRALTQMAQEVVSNARDEIVAGYGDTVDVTIHPDNSMTIRDTGRGIPKGPGNSFEEVVKMLTKPHASGKFDNSNYASAGVAGMHGIGLKAVNAASSSVTIDAVAFASRETDNGERELTGKREHYRITFNQEEIVESSHELVSDDTPTGTSITFHPDTGNVSEDKPRPLFESIEWTNVDLEPMLESTAFLMPGTHVSFTDERADDPIHKEWKYDNGLSDYVMSIVEGQSLVKGMKEPVTFNDTVNVRGYDIGVTGAFVFTSDTSGSVFSHANGVPTREGGPHADAFMNSIVRVMNDVGPTLTKNKKISKLLESDVKMGFTAAFEVSIPGEIASFEGQTKEKLGTTEVRPAVTDIVTTTFTNWLTDNPDVGKRIVESAIAAADTRVKLAKSHQESRVANKTKKDNKLTVSGKLRPASSRNPKERELYVVEGDSASEIGRDPKTQAVFPLKGKILNVMKKGDLQAALNNTEISTLVSTLGAGVGPSFNVDDLQYDKIILAADADSDGSHIRMLLITLFATLMPGLLESGHLYVLVPPLYRAEKYVNGKRELVVAYTDAEMNKMRKQLKGYEVSRYKGLGMMEEEEAHRYIADKEHRQIRQLTIDDPSTLRRRLNIFMGNNAEQRTRWIEETVDFSEAN